METRTGQSKGSDVVLQLLHALEEKDYDRAARFLSNDFTFSGPTPKPVDGKEFIEVHRHLLQAIPDWRFNFNVVKEGEDEVTGRVHITGTHTRDLTLPVMPNLGTINATGKKISLPEEKVHIKTKGNKITRFNVDAIPKGGVMGILSQMGVTVHEPAH
jgi:predicted ester cyclase